MTYRDRRTLNIALLIIIVVIVVVTSLAVIITNVVINHWNFYQIALSIGVTLLIISSIGIYGSYAGGYSVSSFRAHARYPEMAMVESRYAHKRRQRFPIISMIIMAIGIAFAIIGMVGII